MNRIITVDCPQSENPLVRDGIIRSQLPGLQPEYFKIDERSLSDLLLFALRYSRTLQYYNLENVPDGDWQPFILNDVSTFIAKLGDHNLGNLDTLFQQIIDEVNTSNSVSKSYFAGALYRLFDIMFLLTLDVNVWYNQAKDGLKIRSEFKRILQASMSISLSETIGYYKFSLEHKIGFDFKIMSISSFKKMSSATMKVVLIKSGNQYERVVFIDSKGDKKGYSLNDNQRDNLEKFLVDENISITDSGNKNEIICKLASLVGHTLSSDLWTKIMLGHFHPDWKNADLDQGANWGKYVEGIPANGILFDMKQDPSAAQIKDAVDYLASYYQNFLKTAMQVLNQAPVFMEETLTAWPKHEPHMALFLSFLQLFEISQKKLNKFTSRHLDFYYKEILQFNLKPALPDKVHLFMELAKHVPTDSLLARTLFKAGKDEEGKNLDYSLEKETSFNKTQVASLKTLFLDHANDGRAYAAPQANSLDGKGEPFAESHQSWPSFGGPSLSVTEDLQSMENATLGIALSSPLFLLSEGLRVITLNFKVSENMPELPLMKKQFSIKISGEKEWMMPEFSVNLNKAQNIITFIITLELTDGAVTGVDKKTHGSLYHSEYPVIELTLCHPLDKKETYSYQNLLLTKLGSVDFTVKVGYLTGNTKAENSQGLKALILQNDDGNLDAAKPFMPYGPMPKNGGNFFIGHPEIAQKKIKNLRLMVSWQGLPLVDFGSHYKFYDENNISNSSFKVSFAMLLDKVWQPFRQNQTKDLFTQTLTEFPILVDKAYLDLLKKKGVNHSLISVLGRRFLSRSYSSLTQLNEKVSTDKQAVKSLGRLNIFKELAVALPPISHRVFDFKEIDLPVHEGKNLTEDLTQKDTGTSRGFIRLQLTDPPMGFGHQKFRSQYTKKMLQFSSQWLNPPDEPELPLEPYTPIIGAVDLAYEATDSIDFSISDNTENKFYYRCPFGTQTLPENALQSIYFVPQFHQGVKEVESKDEGQLYIGLESLVPRQNITLLFQVAEGSADPEINPPFVHWSYLSQNNWQPFADLEIIDDQTNGLLKSGTITFDMQNGTTQGDALFPEDLFWLKASVGNNATGVCKLIDVKAQAAVALTANPVQYTRSIPAGTISKMRVKDASIKSISQPFASFGGRVVEQEAAFNTRVSERLRHKGRGITIWDYEHIVLENFPQIYKVKCINHSTYLYQGKHWNVKSSELAPGFVTLIVIPDIQNQNSVDPLEPRVSLGLLADIHSYLSTLISPFAAIKLKVINPSYEKVNVQMRVRFKQGKDWSIYSQKTKEDLTQYLSPWVSGNPDNLLFGGKLHQSVLIDFVDELSYVDVVKDFSIDQTFGEKPPSTNKNVEEAVATSARSILVSGKNHIVEEYKL
jgi:hypothetical protein